MWHIQQQRCQHKRWHLSFVKQMKIAKCELHGIFWTKHTHFILLERFSHFHCAQIRQTRSKRYPANRLRLIQCISSNACYSCIEYLLLSFSIFSIFSTSSSCVSIASRFENDGSSKRDKHTGIWYQSRTKKVFQLKEPNRKDEYKEKIWKKKNENKKKKKKKMKTTFA